MPKRVIADSLYVTFLGITLGLSRGNSALPVRKRTALATVLGGRGPKRDKREALDAMVEAAGEIGELSRTLVSTSMAGAQKSNLQRARIIDVVGMEDQIRLAAERSGTNSRTTAARSEAVAADTDAAYETMGVTARTMEETSKTVTMSANLMREFVDRMAEVERIVGTINEIAMRTNLLALNAAIEAAHAGREGDGFTVIAQEIRQLADRTSEQTDDIATKIERMSASAKQAEIAMSKGKVAVEASIVKNAEVQQSFANIREAMHTVQAMSAEVAQASDRQIEAGKRVGTSIAEVDGLAGECTQEADASAEMSMKMVACTARFYEGLQALYPAKTSAMAAEREASAKILIHLGTHQASVRAALGMLLEACAKAGPASVHGAVQCGGVPVPGLRFGAVAATDTLTWVDSVNARTGCVATVFVRDGDRLVRIATNVKRPDGQRATGTALNAKGLAARRLFAGTNHHGAAYVLGKPFLAAYEPVLSKTGELIGAVYVGHAMEAEQGAKLPRAAPSQPRREAGSFVGSAR